MKRTTIVFVACVIAWQIAVGVIYGLFIRYNQTAFVNMSNASISGDEYNFATDGTSAATFTVNSTQFPFPAAIVTIAIILLIVGLAMIAGYIERASIASMAFTLLLFVLTVQNFFIYRDFWNRIQANNPNASGTSFNSQYYQEINYINYGNTQQTNYQYTSASFMDAIGAALALYAGYTAVIGRIGLGQIFFLSWIGTFFYQINSQILWRLYIPDNGFPSRAFAFGGALGIVSSLVLGKRQLTENNPNYLSSYYIRTLSFLGAIFVWCSYPILVTTDVFDSVFGEIVAMSGQVNIWIALAGSVIGCFLASSFVHRKFCVHDIVFASFSGAIAFSSSTNINYNPGAALAIGSAVGFICALGQTRLKRKINRSGSIDSNGTIFQFFVPSLFAAIFSAILSAVGQSSVSISAIINAIPLTTVSFNSNIAPGRSAQTQGGYQIAGWLISIGFGAVTGLLIGIFYWLLDQRSRPEEFYADMVIYEPAKIDYSNPTQENKGMGIR